MKPNIKMVAKVICREVNVETGEIVAYVLEGEYGPTDMQMLKLRQMFNPELKYYAVLKDALTKEQTPIILNLIKTCGECSVAVKI